ncbi:H4MPT-linked C1 transfer pathway protein [Methanocaldococcus infernus ME]|uniref:H4MPT-linked C1 transfer pathway protein n=1 Tax=Methanocaldococcus infernus (strain DSM 11812 / JCM 15783 / ME) TaxID=573063 RepID=D5VT20_METIM|nr:(4-{4-[2-(gamma-L-glutamylamino)ethyl]phenoxymethyl}furan-2-yl)methanamine synthase [Methanocaldococcus infernus]ADG13723.1 H4MPT-linked C1 transfer pathway protein [Methanocaldococcus infernus ME]
MKIIGLDIGGANTKITILEGEKYKIDTHYLPMWKMKDKLVEVLKNYDADYVALVMTAELSDCYKTKKEGVEDIIDKVTSVFDNVYIFDVNGKFLTPEEAKKRYLEVSASNWMATAEFIKRFVSNNCILVDMGSTTTDIIPIKEGRVLAKKTDLDRLMNNQLLYVGALRTPLHFLARKIIFRGKLTNVASEYFAITADINYLLGKVKNYSCETPDGGGKDREGCLIRLSRVVCGDIEMIKEEELYSLAKEFYKKLVEMVREEVKIIFESYGLEEVVTVGLGEEILKEALREYRIKSIKELYDESVSLAMPSFSVAKLLKLTLLS